MTGVTQRNADRLHGVRRVEAVLVPLERCDPGSAEGVFSRRAGSAFVFVKHGAAHDFSYQPSRLPNSVMCAGVMTRLPRNPTQLVFESLRCPSLGG
jgi:hypothetical protein